MKTAFGICLACLIGTSTSWGQKKGEPPEGELERYRVKLIRQLILGTAKRRGKGEMRNYQATIPETGVGYEMVAIPAGEFLMGSPETEANREKDEGPQRKMAVKAFWMGRYEVTWDQFDPFMITPDHRKKNGQLYRKPENAQIDDVISKPTRSEKDSEGASRRRRCGRASGILGTPERHQSSASPGAAA